MKKKEILVSNDDGWFAGGIEALAEALKPLGNITVVAPEEIQSGRSGAISLGALKMRRTLRSDGDGIKVYSFEGTPVDCVKMGIRLLGERGLRPDLIVSGINHGSNVSAATFYSGTVGAASEGAVHGIASIAYSLDSHSPDADFTPLLPYLAPIAAFVLENGLPQGTFLNVNFPLFEAGVRPPVCIGRQGGGKWVDEDEEERDENGVFYRMYGRFVDTEPSAGQSDSGGGIQGTPDNPCTHGNHSGRNAPGGPGTDTLNELNGASGCDALQPDHHILQQGCISMVPHRIDTTDYDECARLLRLWKNPAL